MTPAAENECRRMIFIYQGITITTAAAVRYHAVMRGRGANPAGKTAIGKGLVKRHGEKLAILNFGTLMPEGGESRRSAGRHAGRHALC